MSVLLSLPTTCILFTYRYSTLSGQYECTASPLNQVGGLYVKLLSAPSVHRPIQNEPPIKQSQQRDHWTGHGQTLRRKVIVNLSMSLQYSMPPINYLSLFHVQRHIRHSLMLASPSQCASRWSVTTKFSGVKLPINLKSAPSSWSEPIRSIVIISYVPFHCLQTEPLVCRRVTSHHFTRPGVLASSGSDCSLESPEIETSVEQDLKQATLKIKGDLTIVEPIIFNVEAAMSQQFWI